MLGGFPDRLGVDVEGSLIDEQATFPVGIVRIRSPGGGPGTSTRWTVLY